MSWPSECRYKKRLDSTDVRSTSAISLTCRSRLGEQAARSRVKASIDHRVAVMALRSRDAQCPVNGVMAKSNRL